MSLRKPLLLCYNKLSTYPRKCFSVSTPRRFKYSELHYETVESDRLDGSYPRELLLRMVGKRGRTLDCSAGCCALRQITKQCTRCTKGIAALASDPFHACCFTLVRRHIAAAYLISKISEPAFVSLPSTHFRYSPVVFHFPQVLLSSG